MERYGRFQSGHAAAGEFTTLKEMLTVPSHGSLGVATTFVISGGSALPVTTNLAVSTFPAVPFT